MNKHTDGIPKTFEDAEAAERVATERFHKQQIEAQHRAQLLHDKLMAFPATFVMSLYLADAAGMVRIVGYEKGSTDEPMIRTAMVMPAQMFAEICKIGPRFLADVEAAKAKANGGPPMEVRSGVVDGEESAADVAAMN